MVKKFSEFINESIWADMNRRSQGNQVRKEDDVNNLNMQQFVDYLQNNYELCGRYADMDSVDITAHNLVYTSISVPVIGLRDGLKTTFFHLSLRVDNNDNYVVSIGKYAAGILMFDKLMKEYLMADAKSGWLYVIKPKQGEVDKKFFLKVMNFIITHTEKPEENIIKKK